MHQHQIANSTLNSTSTHHASHIQATDYLNSLNAGKSADIAAEVSTIVANISKYQTQMSKVEKKFQFIDLFAGVGGVRLGFEKAGGKCVFTSEIDSKALATYFCNFGEMVPEAHRDITKIDESAVPDHDILLGGFPCQAFSVAGERKGFNDTRGTLFFDIQRIIAAKRPKAFLLENVKGLIGHDNGKTFNIIKSILETDLGYKVFSKVMNTMEYGDIPQTRERIYIVGFDKNLFAGDVDFSFPTPIPLKKTISNMLESSQADETLYYEKFPIYSTIQDSITKTDTIYQWRRVYVRENKSNACPTLTANMGTGGHNVPLIREKSTNRVRKLSPRECANFQGFPKNYYIPKFMSNSHLYKQFGNSVSVPVIQRIAEQVLLTLKEITSIQ